MKIAIASDHGGFGLKEILIKHLKEQGVEVVDCGTHSTESCDYPDYAEKACRLVQDNSVRFAVLVCGTGLGMSIAANKMKGIRAAVCGEEFSAQFARAHNDANVLALGARVTGPGLAEHILDIFLHTEFEGGRHARRVQKIMDLERKG
jgi:ribose 5-phosphate isomerase B